MRRLISLIISVAVLILMMILSDILGQVSDETGKIELLKARLEEERQNLDSLTEIKQTELEQLNSLEEQLELNSELLSRLNRRLSRLRNQESRLKDETTLLDSLLTRQKTRIAVSLRNFYLKRRRASDILLSSSDFNHAVSQIVYTRQSMESLKDLISDTDSMLVDLKTKTERLETTSSEIAYYLRERRLEKNLLESQRGRREKLMDKIRSEESLYRMHLNQLRADIGAADTLFDEQASSEVRSLFESQKGLLPYPLDGKVIRNFGTYRDPQTYTEIFSPGIEIKGNLDDKIHAVYDGSVFHKGNLRGYGKVLILDHGGGWYTLYAHLSDYAVDMGTAVSTGDIIGYLGESSVKGGPSLHFQIRHKREQLDPIEWLKH